MSYRIFADSCCDYSDPPGAFPWLTRVALTIELDGVQYPDDGTLDTSELLEKMSKSKSAPKTSCPSVGSFLDAFNSDCDDVYLVTLSDKVSGSYSSAVTASRMAAEEGNHRNIHVFNSHSAAAGEVAVCLRIHDLAESGLEFAQVVEQVEEYIRELSTYFLLETLEVLRKNGRLSHLQSIVTSALNLKMVMGAEPDGSIGVRGKALTTDRAITKLVELIKNQVTKLGVTNKRLVITHCNCKKRVEEIMERLMELCPFTEAILCEAGGLSTIYANSGGFIVAF